MKRFVLYIILPLLAGCVADELTGIENGLSNPQSKYITASVAVDNVIGTRGTPINSASEIEDFGFFSSYTETETWESTIDPPNKMYNRKMIRNTTTDFWEYDGKAVEWDNTSAADYYTFFAYAPFATTANGITVTSSAATPGIPTLSYTVPITVQDQPDLMLAVPRKDIHPTGHPVALQMKHALTAIGFMVYGDGTVTGLSVTGVHNSGNLKMDGSNILWNIPSGSVSSLDFSAAIAGGSFSVSSITPQNLLADDGYLMMIPQTLTDDAKVKVTYDGKTYELDLKDATPEWEAGRRVIYSIKIGQGEIVLGTITVTPDYVTVDYHAHTPAAQTLIVTATKGNGSPDPTATWTLTSDQPWLTFTFNNDGSGATATLNGTSTQTVYLVIEENTDTDIRVADISLNDIEHTAIVIQDYERLQTINVTPPYIEFSSAAQSPASQSIIVSPMIGDDPDPTVQWTLNSYAPWLTLTLNPNGSGASGTVNGTGQQTVYIVATANGTSADRFTDIYLNGTKPEVLVRQGVSTETVINVSPSSVELPHYAQYPALQVLTVTPMQGGIVVPNETWKLTSNQSWLWLSLNGGATQSQTVSGKGQQTVYLMVQPNRTYSSRNAGIYLNDLSSNIVTIVTQNYFDGVGESGSAGERIYIDDNGGDPKLMLTRNNNNPGAFFQFGGVRGWKHKTSGNAGSAAYNPTPLTDAWMSGWQYASGQGNVVAHTLDNLRAGKGDPCRLVGFTQAEIEAAIDYNNPDAYAPDNRAWSLPTNGQLDGFTSNKDVFPRFGHITDAGVFKDNLNIGYYWSGHQHVGSPSGNSVSYLHVSPTLKFINSVNNQAFGMGIRCVRL